MPKCYYHRVPKAIAYLKSTYKAMPLSCIHWLPNDMYYFMGMFDKKKSE